MKKAKPTKAFLLSAITCFIMCLNISAQGTRTSTADFLIIDNATISIDNVFTLDSLKGIHVASFEIPLTSSNETKGILNSILTALQGNRIPSLTLITTDVQFHVIEEKNYNSVTVSDIRFSDMNSTTANDIAKVRVRLQAQDVSEKTNSTQKIILPNANVKKVFGNDFAMTLGNLPTQRVSGITNLKISNQQFNGYLSVAVETLVTNIKPWSDWFSNGMATKKEEGSIILKDQSNSTDLFTLQISEVEVISISEFSNVQGVSKAVITLRTKKYMLK